MTPDRAAIELEITPPALVVLVGAAGSGKSTLAGRLFASDDVVSSDALRAAVSGDEADQRATRPAFAILHRVVVRRLAEGRVVVVDATNVERAARRDLLRRAAAARAPAIAIVLALPADLVHARNAARPGRRVPPEFVDRHLGRLDRLVGNGDAAAAAVLRAEGFAEAVVLRSDGEIAALRVTRRPAVSPR